MKETEVCNSHQYEAATRKIVKLLHVFVYENQLTESFQRCMWTVQTE